MRKTTSKSDSTAKVHSDRRPRRRDEFLTVRLERKLAERLRYAAWEADVSRSDKVRRILDATLPQTP